MGKHLAKMISHDERKQAAQYKRDLPLGEHDPLKILQKEAKARGATLTTGGKGGLKPSLVLNVIRRDEYRCKVCGENKNLVVHHKGGVEAPVSRWLQQKGHRNDPNNIVTICSSCHNRVHDDDRERAEQMADPRNED